MKLYTGSCVVLFDTQKWMVLGLLVLLVLLLALVLLLVLVLVLVLTVGCWLSLE